MNNLLLSIRNKWHKILIPIFPFFLKISFATQALRRIWGFWALILLGAFFLLGNSQGRDFFNQFSKIGRQDAIFFYIASFWWCLQIWFGIKLVYFKLIIKPKYVYLRVYSELTSARQAAQLAADLDEWARKVYKWIPRILGFSPLFIILWALKYNTQPISVKNIGLYLASIVFCLVIVFRKNIAEFITRKRITISYPDNNKLKGFWELSTYDKIFAGISLAAFIVIYILSQFAPVELGPQMGPGAILVLALAAWTTIIAIFNYVFSGLPFSLGLTLVLMFYFFSPYNNNNRLRTLDNKVAVNTRPGIDSALTHYFDYRLKTLAEFPGIDTIENIKVPIYIVAAEGGGSRSGSWTSCVLSCMEDKPSTFSLPEQFHNQVFAMSGVSGGTLGIMSYRGLLYHKLTHPNDKKIKNINYEDLAKQVFKSDYLSGMVATLLFGEVVNTFSPVPLGDKTDRATTIEKSWETVFEKYLTDNADSNYYKLGFVESTQFTAKHNIWLPHVFCNGTLMANGPNEGQRAIVSDIQIDTANFIRATDILTYVNTDMPNSTAAMVSARFPFISPLAKITSKDSTGFIKVGDGGYYENSGILTALEIMDRLCKHIENKRFMIKNKEVTFMPTLLILGTNPIDEKNNYNESLHEIANLIPLISGSLFGHASQYERLAIKEANKGRFRLRIATMFTSQDNVPTGWYLSEGAINTVYNNWHSNNNSMYKIIIKP